METTEATTTATEWSEAAAAADETAPWEPLGEPFNHVRHLPLSDASKAELVDEARAIRDKRKALVEEKKAKTKAFNKAIEALDDELDEVLGRALLGESQTIRAQKELRASNVRVVDVETGEVLQERAAEHWELQRELFAENGNGEAHEGEDGDDWTEPVKLEVGPAADEQEPGDA